MQRNMLIVDKPYNGLPHNRRRDYDFLKGYSFEQSLARNLTKATSASAVNAVVMQRFFLSTTQEGFYSFLNISKPKVGYYNFEKFLTPLLLIGIRSFHGLNLELHHVSY